jgi:hypothetical protein
LQINSYISSLEQVSIKRERKRAEEKRDRILRADVRGVRAVAFRPSAKQGAILTSHTERPSLSQSGIEIYA